MHQLWNSEPILIVTFEKKNKQTVWPEADMDLFIFLTFSVHGKQRKLPDEHKSTFLKTHSALRTIFKNTVSVKLMWHKR